MGGATNKDDMDKGEAQSSDPQLKLYAELLATVKGLSKRFDKYDAHINDLTTLVTTKNVNPTADTVAPSQATDEPAFGAVAPEKNPER